MLCVAFCRRHRRPSADCSPRAASQVAFFVCVLTKPQRFFLRATLSIIGDARQPPAVKHHVVGCLDQNQVCRVVVGMVSVNVMDIKAILQTRS